MFKNYFKDLGKRKAKRNKEFAGKIIITPRWLDWLKSFSFIFLSGVSALLVTNIMVQLVASPFEKITMGIVALVYEILKIVSLLTAMIAITTHKYFKATLFIGLYISFASIAILANYGYILESVNKAETDPVVLLQIETEKVMQEDINNLNIEFVRLTTDEKLELNELDAWRLEHKNDKDFSLDYFSRKRSKIRTYYSTMKNRKQSEIKGLRAEFSKLKKKSFEDDALKAGKNRMFLLLGNAFGMTENSIKFKFLIVIAFMIEFGILISSPKKKLIKIKDKEKKIPIRKMVPKAKAIKLVETVKPQQSLVTEKTIESKEIKKRTIKKHLTHEIVDLIYSNRLRLKEGEFLFTQADQENYDINEVKALIDKCTKLTGKSGLPFLSIDKKANKLKKNYTKEYLLENLN